MFLLRLYFWVIFVLAMHQLAAQNTTLIDSLKKELTQTTDFEKQAKLHIELGLEYFETDSLQATIHANQAFAIAHQLNDPYLLGGAYKIRSTIQEKLKYYDRAFHYADSAYHFYQIANDTSGMLAVLNNIGRGYCHTGDCPRGVEAYQRAEKWLKNDGYKLQVIRINHALCLQDCDAHLECIELCEATLPFSERDDQPLLQMFFHALIGSSSLALEQPAKALNAFNQALKLLPSENENVHRANLLSDRAEVYISLENYERAYQDLQESIELNKRNGIRRNDARSLLLLGKTTKALGQFAESKNWYQQALQELNATKDNTILAEAYAESSELLRATNDAERAYDQLHLAYDLRDSLMTAELRKNVQELNVRYETERVKKELAETSLIVSETRNRERLWLFSGVVSLLIVSLLATFSVMRQRRRSLQIEKRKVELEYGLLRAQMNPHFVFNSLNSIQGYFAGNRFAAGNEFLGKFSQLIRRVLDQSTTPEVPLSEELETLSLYLELEKLRMEEQLNYEFQVDPDLEIDLINVPPLILQPFVENAIWHGIAPKEATGQIEISLKTNTAETLLYATITDDGIGLPTSKNNGEHQSKGIQITRERLGAGSLVKVANRMDGKGVKVELVIPI
ncbi:MAG: histidine kinase [Saprospiraceae bacterium]